MFAGADAAAVGVGAAGRFSAAPEAIAAARVGTVAVCATAVGVSTGSEDEGLVGVAAVSGRVAAGVGGMVPAATALAGGRSGVAAGGGGVAAAAAETRSALAAGAAAVGDAAAMVG